MSKQNNNEQGFKTSQIAMPDGSVATLTINHNNHILACNGAACYELSRYFDSEDESIANELACFLTLQRSLANKG